MSKSIEWKKQDKIFCVLPFVQHYISTQGWSELCCDASYKGRDYESKLDWNSKNLVKARQLFNEGKWPSECGFCISREQQGGKSLRMLSNKQWQREYDHFFNNPTVHPPLPISYDLRLGNFCNLECVMCNPESSDKIGKSMNAYFGNKPNTIYDGDTFRSSDYTEKQMIDKILNDPTNVKKIYLSGGEPFIMPGVLHLLEKLCDSGHSKHIKLHVSTNATVLRTDWVDKWFSKFSEVLLAMSIDAIGERAEYVRYGHKWSTASRRIENMANKIKTHHNVNLHMGATVHAATVTQIKPLYEWAKNLRLGMDFHTVIKPKWLRPERVPNEVKEPVIEWIDSQPQYLMDYYRLNTVKGQLKLDANTTDDDLVHQHRYIRFLNATYPIKWKDAVPELKDWDPEQ